MITPQPAAHDGEAGVAGKDAGEDAEERQPHDDLAGKLRGADRGHAQVQRRVSLLMLQGVAALMRGDADRGERIALVILRGEHEPLVRGVVVIAEHAFLRDDFHVADARALQDGGGDLRAGGVEDAPTWL